LILSKNCVGAGTGVGHVALLAMTQKMPCFIVSNAKSHMANVLAKLAM
jgi:hypothetical protein